MSRVDEWMEAKTETITVDNHVTAGGYTSYEVSHVAATNSVRRRYSDFVRLYKTLKLHFPGAFIPPLPVKKAVGRFAEEFIDCRKRGLQHFMVELLKSPDFQNLNYVNAFWQHEDVQEWIGLASAVESPPSVGWMKRKMNAMQVSKEVLQQYNDIVENDVAINDIQKSIDEIWKKNKRTEAVAVQLLKCIEKTQAVIDSRSKAAERCYEVDVANETEVGGATSTNDKALHMFSETESILAARLKQHCSNVKQQFVEPTQRYTNNLESFQKSIDSQNTLKNNYVAKDIALRKQKATESELETSQNTYELGVQRVIRDYDRYRESRTSDVCSNLLELCDLQVENFRMMSLAWQQLEESLLSYSNVSKDFSSDRYNVTSYQEDRSKLYSGLDQSMLAELTQDDDDEGDCMSV